MPPPCRRGSQQLTKYLRGSFRLAHLLIRDVRLKFRRSFAAASFAFIGSSIPLKNQVRSPLEPAVGSLSPTAHRSAANPFVLVYELIFSKPSISPRHKLKNPTFHLSANRAIEEEGESVKILSSFKMETSSSPYSDPDVEEDNRGWLNFPPLLEILAQKAEQGMGKEAETRNLVLSKYEMGRVLGKGTFAKVYLGRDLRTGESVAIKVIQKDRIRRQAGMVEQIEREISVMRLVRHHHVVELREVMATRSRIFFVMEYVRGGELFARVARGALPEDQARRYFRQIISAVDFCHRRGVSHRDLKPENLLLDHEGNLKVSDFGLSALPEQRRHDGLLHTQCGTPTYVAPEVLRRRGYDGAKADLWSCGVILYVLLAGFLPFREENMMRMYCKVLKAEYQTPPWFSRDACRLISSLLVANPENRISIPAIMEHPWFKKGACSQNLPPLPTSPPSLPPPVDEDEQKPVSPKFYNAFELISSLSSGFDLSSLFDNRRPAGTVFTSSSPAAAIVEQLERAGRGLGFDVRRAKPYEVKMEKKGGEGWRQPLEVTAEVFEVAARVAVVELSKDSGESSEFTALCEEELRPALKDIVWAWQGATNADGGEE